MPGFMEFSNDLGIYYHKWCQFIKKNFKNYAIFKVHVDFNRSYRFYFYNSRIVITAISKKLWYNNEIVITAISKKLWYTY